MAIVAVPTESVLDLVMPPDASELIESDGEPMDSPWHRAAIDLLIDSLSHQWRDRDDFYVGGNMFVYFSADQARSRDFRGPDFFVVLDVPRTPVRKYWATWLEGGRYPDFILELTSPTTAVEDRGSKKRVYERTFHTSEYVLHDPETNRTEGWRLGPDLRYAPIVPDARGWIWSEVLRLWIGQWGGSFEDVTEPAIWPRFFTPDGALVATGAEFERHRADTERHRADTERQRADTECQRAEAAEAEVARLRALLEGLDQR